MAVKGIRLESKRRIAMKWETPEFVEISLGCEISGYANAELGGSVKAEPTPGAESEG
jgi:coenzyme PQQ precursor peptide PqqA